MVIIYRYITHLPICHSFTDNEAHIGFHTMRLHWKRTKRTVGNRRKRTIAHTYTLYVYLSGTIQYQTFHIICQLFM
jgi:hypothetical protein